MQYNKLEDTDNTDGGGKHIQSKEIINGGSISLDRGLDADARRKKHIKWGIIGAIILIIVILAIVLPLVLIKKGGGGGDQHGPLPPGKMNPYQSIPGSQKASGAGASVSGYLLSNLDGNQAERLAQSAVPKQFLQFLAETTQGDEDPKIQQQSSTDNLKKVGVDWRNLNFFGPNNMLKGNLSYQIDVVSTGIMRLVLTEANETRFSIPDNMVPQNGGDPSNRLDMMGFKLYNDQTDTFGFQVTDVTNPNNVLLSTINQTLIFSDKYIQMDYILPSQFVYGLGDRIHEFRLSEGAFTLWASGQDGEYDDGRGRGGLSGVHPFLLVQTANPKRYIGLYFRNSNAMTPVLRYNDDGVTSTLSFITIGGQLEVYIFNQGSAHEVIQAYQQMNQLPRLPPFWALGWQEASPNLLPDTNYQASVLQAAQNYKLNGFPLDAVYLQADSWDSTNDFQLDTAKFPDVSQLVTALQGANQRLVAYIDAGVNVKDRTKNPAYLAGKNIDGFIKSQVNPSNPDGYLVNSKSNKNVVFVDWLNSKCLSFWSVQVGTYYTNVKFDGLWTTQNEPFGDVAGEIAEPQQESQTPQRLLEIAKSHSMLRDAEVAAYDQSWFASFWPLNDISTYYLPFIPRLNVSGNYDQNTLSLNATHVNNVSDYDAHSLYSHGMMRATYNALANNDNRPFILTKGSFASTSAYTGVQAHTNNERSWDSLYYGLASVLRSQMFGMPMSGTDVCGYYNTADGTLDEELCLRWYQLASFFPLARHSQEGKGPRTEPFNFKNAAYKAQLQKTMHDRMQYLRLLYTCIFQSSDSGGACIEPLQFSYVIPPNKLNNSANQLPDFTNSFMFAGALKVSPIMNQTGASTTFQSYFPKGLWVNMANWTEVIVGTDDMVTLQVRDTTNVHLAPGAIIPFQNNSDMTMFTTADVLAKPISLVANRDQNGAAGGSLFLDQGISRAEMQGGLYEYYNFNLQVNSIQVQRTNFDKNTQPHLLDSIFIVNASDLMQTNFACYFRPDSLVPQPLQFEPLTDKNTLRISTISATKFSDILNIYYGNSLTDLNLCNVHSWDYDIVGGAPNITGSKSVTFNLTHKAKVLDDINMTISFFDTGIINFRWTWANQSATKRVPYGVPSSLVDTTPRDQGKILDTLDKYLIIKDQPFSVQVMARITGSPENVFTIQGLIFDEYLSWVKVQAYAQPSATEEDFHGIFGLGERSTKNFFYKSGVYSLWAKDIDNPIENGKLPGNNIYGTHPFYIYKHSKNSWLGVYHNLAQAQDWWINNDYASGNVSISTVATGGLGDIYVILSSQKPESIIAKYRSLTGNPVLTPQWSLGWNQCKWCYRDLNDVKQSMQGYADNGIPLDTQWVDIDYMRDYQDFTYASVDMFGNPGSFAGLPDFVKSLHQKNMKFVPIIDAGVSYRPGKGYTAFDQGMQQDVFLKINGSPFIGKVWPNEAAYPDFTHPNAQPWWSAQLTSFQGQVPFDGLWQDMNEASNFCNGNCHGDTPVASPIMNKLIYTPTDESLETKSIALDVTHYNGFNQLDAHSLFGALQVASSSSWFKSNNKRPMIISRSSFAGMGKYGSTWLGDNHARLDDLETSVLSIMNMNIFGIPLTGTDICGFGGENTTPELCARWHAVGAFYPFSRNHRDCNGAPQEAWRFNATQFDSNSTYTDLMRSSILRKYHLIRYYYTQMTQMSLGNNTFYMLYKPLFFEFAEDMNSYKDIANNVMVGPAIKTSVNAKSLTQNTTDFYFPAGTWCSLFEPIGECIYNEVGQNVTLGSQLNESYAHLREGFIVPMQNATALKARTTVDLQKAPVDFHILGSFRVPGIPSWSADGQYLNDDGLSTNLTGNVNQYRINAQYSQSQGEVLTLTVSQIMTASNYLNPMTNCSAVNQADYLQSVYVYNATGFKKHDSLWVSVAYVDNINSYTTIGSASYDEATNRFVFDGTILGNLICLTRVFRIQMRNLLP